ncbi:immunity 53 family protein [Clostridium intestinale]|uniref:immunity 53 family protein n=1 Tax=Clostridium intestinale TaxID=36845 RepID=UPI002DD63435|nr:immunity 53 family protein [Clostridium intestinale]WRY52642.1 immunity 53 family protein [Clostridium intestinale]
MNNISWLNDWYKNNCNGDWEHCYGIKIDTLDNPGWSVDIDLIETSLEGKLFNTIQIYNSDDDWIHCSVVDDVFRGRGSVDKLERIIILFKEWAVEN